MRHALFLAPFGECSEPGLVADLAADAEAAGFDGFFVWDHVLYAPVVEQVADPWVVLTAVAARTSRLRIGPMVTPVARRRPHKLARETVTLDRFSGGRLVLGVGLGSDRRGELVPFGEPVSALERARLLDEGLDLLSAYWAGEQVGETGMRFLPRALQSPRIPVWVASTYPRTAPLRRAARWDGWFPIGMESPEQLAEPLERVRGLRGDLDGFDVVLTGSPEADPSGWARAGATWWLTGFGPTPRADDVRAVIAAGPNSGPNSGPISR